MIFGIEIDEAYLRAMDEFKGKVITQADMASVARRTKGVYQGDAEKRQAELKGEYGTGCVVSAIVFRRRSIDA